MRITKYNFNQKQKKVKKHEVEAVYFTFVEGANNEIKRNI